MKRAMNRTLSMVLVASLAGAPAMNAFAAAPPETQASQAQTTTARGIQELSKKDLKELADYGAKRGEDVSDLRAYAEGKDQQRGIGIGFKIARKALVLVLKRGGPVLERALKKFPRSAKVVKKYNSKIVDALGKLDSAEEAAVRKVLTESGVNKKDAATIAPWISYMLF
jgi:hypothetical protein